MIWFLLTPFALLVHATGYIVVPVALLFCKPEDEHLPRLFWLWDNPGDGINGDGDSTWGWRGPEHANGRERTYWWRLLWMYRNAGYGFARWAGAELVNMPVAVGPDVSNQSGVTGRRKVTVRAIIAGRYRNAWELYVVWRWPGTSRCIRIRMGWKINGCVTGDKAMLVVSFSPFKAIK